MFCLRKTRFTSCLSNSRIATILFLVALTLLYTLVACTTTDSNMEISQTAYREVAMAQLTINLQEGFTKDLVVIQVNSQEVFRKEGVQTKLLLGFADSFEVQVPEGNVKVETILPSRNLSKTIDLKISTTVYLGISIQKGNIQYRVSPEPFGYM